jgi:hypothetical protein
MTPISRSRSQSAISNTTIWHPSACIYLVNSKPLSTQLTNVYFASLLPHVRVALQPHITATCQSFMISKANIKIQLRHPAESVRRIKVVIEVRMLMMMKVMYLVPSVSFCNTKTDKCGHYWDPYFLKPTE